MTRTERLKFTALVPKQTKQSKVALITATIGQIGRIARIDRLSRNSEGVASGFQRPQIASHIRDIGDYFQEFKGKAVLANPIVLGFVEGASLKRVGDRYELAVEVRKKPAGLIVDGQQRFSALTEIGHLDFEVPVSVLLCDSEQELGDQFILINTTKPLSQSLISELLPRAGRTPRKYRPRKETATLIEVLNHRRGSSLRGLIWTQTNPHGVIKDTAIHKVLSTSLSDGALRLYRDNPKALESRGVDLINEYFHAVRHVFHDAWEGHTPRTSRLVHGVGICAMGYVMEHIHAVTGATRREDFIAPLTALRPSTAWTEGQWQLGPETRAWNSLQGVSADWKLLSLYMVREVQKALGGPLAADSRVRG